MFAEEVRRGSSRLWYRIVSLAVPVMLVVTLVVTPLIRSVFLDDESAVPTLEDSNTGLVDLSRLLSVEGVEDVGIRNYVNQETGVDALVSDDVTALFVVPNDYVATGKVEWLHTKSRASEEFAGDAPVGEIESLLREAVISDHLSNEVKERFVTPPMFVAGVIQPDGTVDEGTEEASLLSVSYIFAFILLYGQRMTLGGVFRALRQAS